MRHVIALAAGLLSVAMTLGAGSDPDLIGQPARARNILASLPVIDPTTGKELLVLSNNNEASNTELVFVDPDTNTGTVIGAPTGAGAETVVRIPGNRLILGTFFNGTILIFDLEKRTFIKSIPFPGEQYIWGFAKGNDGRYYFGTFPGGKLGAINPTTYEIEDLGAAAPPNPYLRTVVPLLDGRILCRYLGETIPPWLIYDPQSKTFSPFPPEIRAKQFVTVWNGYLVAGNEFYDRDFHLVSSPPVAKTIPLPQPVRGARRGSGAWTVDTTLTTPGTLFMRQGKNLWRLRSNSSAPEFVTSVDLHGGILNFQLHDGRLFGIRGQEYFLMKPGDTDLSLRPIPGESAPRYISFAQSDPQGRIWGGPPYGQTLFYFDPANKSTVDTPTISDRGGEVYDLTFLDGFAYAAAYSGGELIRYDPNDAWDQWDHKNPKTIASVLSAGFNRPTGGVIVGPGKKLYSGWMAGIPQRGGAIAITDPKSGATDIIAKPFGDQDVMTMTTDGQLVYVGTGLDPNVSNPKSAMLAALDPATKTFIWQLEVSGASRVRAVGYDAMTKLVVTIVDNQIRLFDTVSRTFQPDPATPAVASWSNATPGNGMFYFGSGRQVLALDLTNRSFKVLAEVPEYVNNVAVAPNGDVYFGAWMNLYVIHNAAENARHHVAR